MIAAVCFELLAPFADFELELKLAAIVVVVAWVVVTIDEAIVPVCLELFDPFVLFALFELAPVAWEAPIRLIVVVESD